MSPRPIAVAIVGGTAVGVGPGATVSAALTAREAGATAASARRTRKAGGPGTRKSAGTSKTRGPADAGRSRKGYARRTAGTTKTAAGHTGRRTFRRPLVAALLARHADPRTPDRTGKPPIVYAAARASVPIVDRLLATGIDVNARYANQLTVLMWVAGYADGAREADGIALVGDLLARGARVDDADNRGRTALMIAAERGHAAVAKLLLAHGADAARRDKAGKTAADLAASADVRAVLTRG